MNRLGAENYSEAFWYDYPLSPSLSHLPRSTGLACILWPTIQYCSGSQNHTASSTEQNQGQSLPRPIRDTRRDWLPTRNAPKTELRQRTNHSTAEWQTHQWNLTTWVLPWLRLQVGKILVPWYTVSLLCSLFGWIRQHIYFRRWIAPFTIRLRRMWK